MARLSPRDAIKAIWRRWAEVVCANRLSSSDGPWGDSFQQRNSLTDAQLLLTLLLPEGDVSEFSLAGTLSDIAADSLKDLNAKAGQSIDKGLREVIEDLLLDFFTAYGPRAARRTSSSKKSGASAPAKAKGRFDFTSPSKIDLQRDDVGNRALGTGRSDITSSVEVVDSFAVSLILCLHVLLLRKRRTGTMREGREADRWNDIARMASERLTAAMTGLLASFAVYEIDTGEWEKVVRRDWPESSNMSGNYAAYARTELSQIRNELDELGEKGLKSGHGQYFFFEFGWSWGPLRAQDVLVGDEDNVLARSLRQFSDGLSVHAIKAPYFYFTASALDAIEVLASEKVSAAEILDDDQLVLASRLRNLASLTKRYWATVGLARDNTGVWAVQQIPWIPADGEEFASEYWNLYILRLIFDRLPTGTQAISRAIKIAEDLAARARITQAPSPRLTDPQVVSIHQRGQQLGLETEADDDDDRQVIGYWRINDFAPQLLKVVASFLSLTTDAQVRQRLTDLMNEIWRHLEARRDEDSSKYAWDNLHNTFVDRGESFNFWEDQKGLQPSSAKERVGNWYITFRVIEALVASAKSVEVRPDAARQVQQLSLQLLSEIEWLSVSDETIDPARRDEVAQAISRARTEIEDRPAISIGIALRLAMDLADITASRYRS